MQRLASEANHDGLEVISNFIVGFQDNDFNLSSKDTVPRFWANSTGNDFWITDIIMLGVGICFGAIHCIAWGFSLPSHTELLIWQVSSVAITTIPTYIALTFGLATWLDCTDFNNAADIAVLSIFPAGILYILAQVFTLVLAFTSLRDLPPGAFDTIHWTTFIPHV